MSTPIVWTAPTDLLVRIALAGGGAASAVKAAALRLDAWLAARRRAAQDRGDLAAMSDRELADIGVARSSIDVVAQSAWLRSPMI
jgi:uncharacterized protein YjiS (DUF1127 family)